MIERKDDRMEAKNIKKSSKNKENKGIILIALLMSIKVLIIIVAITINLLTGDNGVLKKEETNENSQEEIEEMLKQNGIAAFSQEAGANVAMHGAPGFGIYGVDIFVKTDDAEKAVQLIKEINNQE